VSITAPPRPPRLSDRIDREAHEALVEALIEEARQRARHRRRTYGAIGVLITLVGVAAFVVVERTIADATSQNASPARAAVSALPAGTIALTGLGSDERTVLWSGRGLGDPGIRGRAFGWSPDGSRLLVTRGGSLYVVRGNGTGEVLIANEGDGYNAVWSPDGTRIAFGSRSGYQAIHIARSDGTGVRRLPGTAIDGLFFSGNLTWSPDGTQLLFAGRSATDRRQWLYLVRTDRRASPHPLTIRAEISRPSQPTWSPDGSKIAFSVTQERGGGIYVMNADGTAVRRVAVGHGPVWSPDSSKIAFRTSGYYRRVNGLPYGGNWTVHADGTHLATLPPGSWGGLSWSPDSKLVAFAGGAGHAPNGDVFVARADGTGLTRILHRPGDAYFLPLWRHGTASTETG
jgi:dipeptidyl aminopeptidase/acylaminoacyl peptidase